MSKNTVNVEFDVEDVYVFMETIADKADDIRFQKVATTLMIIILQQVVVDMVEGKTDE